MKPAILVILSVLATGCSIATNRRVFDQEKPKVMARAEAFIQAMDQKNYSQAWTYLSAQARKDRDPGRLPNQTTEQYYVEWYKARQLVLRQIGASKAKWVTTGRGPFRSYLGLIDTPVEMGLPESRSLLVRLHLLTYWLYERSEDGKGADWFLITEKPKK